MPTSAVIRHHSRSSPASPAEPGLEAGLPTSDAPRSDGLNNYRRNQTAVRRASSDVKRIALAHAEDSVVVSRATSANSCGAVGADPLVRQGAEAHIPDQQTLAARSSSTRPATRTRGSGARAASSRPRALTSRSGDRPEDEAEAAARAPRKALGHPDGGRPISFSGWR